MPGNIRLAISFVFYQAHIFQAAGIECGAFENSGPFWWPTFPNFTSLWSPYSLSVTGLGAPLS